MYFLDDFVQLGFCCLDVGYPDLSRQLMHANLSVFLNRWSYPHEFTPTPDTFYILPVMTFTTFMAPVPDVILPLLSMEVKGCFKHHALNLTGIEVSDIVGVWTHKPDCLKQL